MLIKRFSAEQEYAKDSDLPKESVTLLLDWVTKQPHLPKITEEDVILFLSSCYYSVEQAKHVIDTYYTFRTHVPELFANRDPFEKSSADSLKRVCYVAMPGLTDEGYKVFHTRLMDTNPSFFDLTRNMKSLFYVMDLALIEDGASNGVRIIIDMKGVTLAHILRINPLGVKKILFYLQEAMPVRLRGMHFANPTSIMDRALALMRPFLNKSTSENIHVHNDTTDLHKYIPKRILSVDVDGDQPSLEILHAETMEKLNANRDWITSEEKYRVNETLRPGKAKSASDLFGVEGSFKKLDID